MAVVLEGLLLSPKQRERDIRMLTKSLEKDDHVE